MGYGYGIVASGFVNEDGTQRVSSLEQSHSNFSVARESEGLYLVTLPVAIGAGALQVFATRAGTIGEGESVGGLPPLLVTRVSATTFRVTSVARGEIPFVTDAAFTLLVLCSDGVSFDPSFDIVGMGTVNADGTEVSNGADPSYYPTVSAGVYQLTTGGYSLAQMYEVNPQLCHLGSARAFGTITCTTKAVRAGGVLTAVAKAQLIEAETFTLNDGTNAPTVFEFDGVAGAADGVAGGNVAVDVSGVATAIAVAGVIHAAINAVGAGLAITSVDNGDGTLTLTNDAYSASGNAAQSETVVDPGFSITTPFAGGVTGILDTETVVVGDGTQAAVTLEFSTDGVAGGGNALVNISTDSSAIQIAARLAAAINAVGAALLVTARDNGDGTIRLSSDNGGTAGNVVITDTVVAAAFTHTGMAGGLAWPSFALRAQIVSDSVLRCYPYDASLAETLTPADFAFVAVRGRNRSL
jgi:hypothetical protein